MIAQSVPCACMNRGKYPPTSSLTGRDSAQKTTRQDRCLLIVEGRTLDGHGPVTMPHVGEMAVLQRKACRLHLFDWCAQQSGC